MHELTARPMIYKEARECVEKINANLTDIRHLVLDLYEREGWSAMGYTSWRECVTAEFHFKQSHVYELLEAAKTERNISAIAEKEIPESQLRPLTKLRDNPEAQKEAWRQAVATAPEGLHSGSLSNDRTRARAGQIPLDIPHGRYMVKLSKF
jgi:hypothetical protein